MSADDLQAHLRAVSEAHEYHARHSGWTGMVAFTFFTDRASTPNVSGESYPLEFRVSVDAVHEEFRAERDALVEMLRLGAAARSAVREAELAVADARDRAAHSAIARRQSDSRLDEILGRAPAGSLMGPAEVRPHEYADWTGKVWLLDPVKRFNGFGFQFDGLADLWRIHPYLRPVACGTDELGPWMRVERHRHVLSANGGGR